MAQFLSEMKPFELSSSELLMLCNHCPISPVELHLLIEESEERLDEQQVRKSTTVGKESRHWIL